MAAEYKPFAAHALSLNLDDETFGEIASMDAQLATDTRPFEQAQTARQEAIKAAGDLATPLSYACRWRNSTRLRYASRAICTSSRKYGNSFSSIACGPSTNALGGAG